MRSIGFDRWQAATMAGVELRRLKRLQEAKQELEEEARKKLEQAQRDWSSRGKPGRPRKGEDPPRSRPDLRERIAARFLRLVNPLARRLIVAGRPTGAPNILLTVRGRRSGTPHTVPVSLLELDGRRFVQASYGATGWAVNLRAAGEAIMTEHGRSTPVQAVELPSEEAGVILRRALEPYRRSRLLRALLGPRWRPPVALLGQYRIRVDETPEDYLVEARRHPLFELRHTPPR